MRTEILHTSLIVAGIGQIVTAILYPFVRYRVLGWFEDLKNLKPLNAAIAKTYGFYIQGINFCFGLLSLVLIEDIMTPSNLSIALSGFIAVYWIGRISFQLKSYSFKDLSSTKKVKTGIWGMNLLITFFALTYTVLFLDLITQ